MDCTLTFMDLSTINLATLDVFCFEEVEETPLKSWRNVSDTVALDLVGSISIVPLWFGNITKLCTAFKNEWIRFIHYSEETGFRDHILPLVWQYGEDLRGWQALIFRVNASLYNQLSFSLWEFVGRRSWCY